RAHVEREKNGLSVEISVRQQMTVQSELTQQSVQAALVTLGGMGRRFLTGKDQRRDQLLIDGQGRQFGAPPGKVEIIFPERFSGKNIFHPHDERLSRFIVIGVVEPVE